MKIIDAARLSCTALNEALREQAGEPCRVEHCLGQRFIAAGMEDCRVSISGVPGNALAAYLNGGELRVEGNAQDAVGDTMNGGSIVIDGCVGDAAGYAMRGGSIYVHGDAGYRAGVHMKEYGDRLPVMIIGGRAGSFLGEYQAGGIIAVLGLGRSIRGRDIVGFFPCTGMHGGKVFLRGDHRALRFPSQVTARLAEPGDLEALRPHLACFCKLFGEDEEFLLASPFTLVTPDTRNPYRQMYVAN